MLIANALGSSINSRNYIIPGKWITGIHYLCTENNAKEIGNNLDSLNLMTWRSIKRSFKKKTKLW